MRTSFLYSLLWAAWLGLSGGDGSARSLRCREDTARQEVGPRRLQRADRVGGAGGRTTPASGRPGPSLSEMDPDIRRFLGRRSTETIRRATRAEAYLLDTLGAKGAQFAGYTIREKGPTLTAGQLGRLKAIVGRRSNWGLDQLRKSCVFMPLIGLELVHRQERLNLLICFTCDEWRFVQAGQARTEDCDKARMELLGLFRDVFKNSREVQELN